MALSGLVRLGTVCFGCILLGWTAVTLPIFWRTAAAEHTAGTILAGAGAESGLVERQLSESKAPDHSLLSRPGAKRADAILRLDLYEAALAAGKTELADDRLRSLDGSLREALHFVPSDAYLWLVLFSIENATEGYKSDHLEYLRMSYRLGPHEGWIALKRNPVTLAMLPALDPELAGDVLDEFAALVENGFYTEAAVIFAHTNPANRERILARLSSVPEDDRKRFSQELADRLPSLALPGVSREDERPWKR